MIQKEIIISDVVDQKMFHEESWTWVDVFSFMTLLALILLQACPSLHHCKHFQPKEREEYLELSI